MHHQEYQDVIRQIMESHESRPKVEIIKRELESKNVDPAKIDELAMYIYKKSGWGSE